LAALPPSAEIFYQFAINVGRLFGIERPAGLEVGFQGANINSITLTAINNGTKGEFVSAYAMLQVVKKDSWRTLISLSLMEREGMVVAIPANSASGISTSRRAI
jgi:hypothetical protein